MKSIFILLLFTSSNCGLLLLFPEDKITLEIKLGTPPQSFRLHPDTTANFSQIPSSSLINGDNATKVFNAEKSTTFKETSVNTFIDNLHGNCQVHMSTDNFEFQGMTIKQFDFALVNKYFESYRDNKWGKLAFGYKNPISENYLFMHVIASNVPGVTKQFTFAYQNNSFSLDIGIEPLSLTDYSFCSVPYDETFKSL